jgi:hypothetical protein
MYKIIGGDGNEYGPVDLEQLQQWIRDGRAGAQTKVRREGSAEWQVLSEVPELAALMGPPRATATPPPFSPTPAVGVVGGDAAQMVRGPATGLIVTALLGFLGCAAAMVMNLMGVTFGAMHGPSSEELPSWVNAMAGGLGIVQSIFGIILSTVILFGALKMKKLESYTFAIVATIIAMVPCISPCCIVGLPIGIWALLVLNKPEVKSAFH